MMPVGKIFIHSEASTMFHFQEKTVLIFIVRIVQNDLL